MANIFEISLHGMQNDIAQVQNSANNLANISTPGFKRQAQATTPFFDVVNQLQYNEGVAGAGGDERRVDLAAGALRVTSQPLHVALTGPGFFEIQTTAGPRYTRNGEFHLDAAGRLVTPAGDSVMGQDGPVTLTSASPVIDSDGRITESGRQVNQLRVIAPQSADQIVAEGQGLYAFTEPGQAVAQAETHVRQGALETSNVDSGHEMVQLMQIMQHAQTMQKLSLNYDEMMNTALRKLGEL